MRVRSFIRRAQSLLEVEIDVSLVPGLPQIVLLGLPDAGVRESAERIRAAIRRQGFKWPRAQRVLVQLRPHSGRKSGEGLDFAIAAALLAETRQIQLPELTCLYGAVSLAGEVEAPTDLDELETSLEVWTGDVKGDLPFASRRLRTLADLRSPCEISAANRAAISFVAPPPAASSFSAPLAELASIVALGEHATLLAGAAGIGKTTWAASIPAWLEAPCTPEAERAARRAARESGCAWRPLRRPHHSVTPLAMIGGGLALWAGEVHRAHTGVLVLDELAEFHPAVHEALREPADAGTVQISRGGRQRDLGAKFLLLATTNLCDCGAFVPGLDDDQRCRCRNLARRRHLARLSGPLLDRFQIVALLGGAASVERVSANEIETRVRAARAFQKARGQEEPSGRTPIEPLLASLSAFQRQVILENLSGESRRRENAAVRVARSLADLRGSISIANTDLQRAIELAWRGHHLLEEAR